MTTQYASAAAALSDLICKMCLAKCDRIFYTVNFHFTQNKEILADKKCFTPFGFSGDMASFILAAM